MSEMNQENAVITKTTLGDSHHGLFTFSLYLKYGAGSQTAGHITLDGPVKDSDEREGWDGAIPLLRKILDVAGVELWEELKGQHIRVVHSWSTVKAIGHITKDIWLDFEEVVIKEEEKHNGSGNKSSRCNGK